MQPKEYKLRNMIKLPVAEANLTFFDCSPQTSLAYSFSVHQYDNASDCYSKIRTDFCTDSH